ncbi:MAG: GHKL domain-containing protein [Deltaproteobacteria bacterium]|nr:GHKL domain-containing protein [Deltaproteobacteria bacterium]NCP03239.1 GHKL domain-containing protein [Deltaproteobacteria bacterium]
MDPAKNYSLPTPLLLPNDIGLLWQHAPIALASLAADGRIRAANQRWCDFTGQQNFPLAVDRVVHASQLAALRQMLLDVSLNYRQGNLELQLHRKDGEYRWFQLRCLPLNDTSDSCLTAAFYEMTDAGMAEEQLIAINASLQVLVNEQTRHLQDVNQQLQETQSKILQSEKMASIGLLAAGVAHEINNPLGFINSNLNSLERYLKKIRTYIKLQTQVLHQGANAEQLAELQQQRRQLKLDLVLDDAGDLISESLEGTSRVQKIVLDLKSFSRLDKGDEQAINLNECLETTIGIAWNELKYKVDLEKNYGALEPLYCLPQQLNQVFLNILINAVQAIDKQGKILIKTWQAENKQYVSITDNGCGMPAEVCAQIFEPFFTTKKMGQGTGLGLSISYDVIKKHGGEITVNSQVGRGTTFTLCLPCREKGALHV